jgi:hypothetical protein
MDAEGCSKYPAVLWNGGISFGGVIAFTWPLLKM